MRSHFSCGVQNRSVSAKAERNIEIVIFISFRFPVKAENADFQSAFFQNRCDLPGKRSGGLPEFLVANPGVNSGYMIPQYAAAAMVSQNKMYCYSAASDSIVSSNGQEDHVSMGANAATKLLKLIDNLYNIFAIELMNAAQAVDFRRPVRTSPILETILAEFRKEVPFVEDDIVMYKAINRSADFVRRMSLGFIEWDKA